MSRAIAKKWLEEKGLVDDKTGEKLPIEQLNVKDYVKSAKDANKIDEKVLPKTALDWINRYPRAAKKTVLRAYQRDKDAKAVTQIKLDIKASRQNLQGKDVTLTADYYYKLLNKAFEEIVSPELEGEVAR